MIVLNSWAKLNQITEQCNTWENLTMVAKEDCHSYQDKSLSTYAKLYPKWNPLSAPNVSGFIALQDEI